MDVLLLVSLFALVVGGTKPPGSCVPKIDPDKSSSRVVISLLLAAHLFAQQLRATGWRILIMEPFFLQPLVHRLLLLVLLLQ